ncbi:saccharopine dehydrogenase-like oxidoreductase [Phlebotomus papatasi]|uniref:saccharopine dehydrogenase-like oxidoreductase n=1 Tax=Phlebotomus papatasi TaxID=29031 RepID=UPI002483E054|nr:saccharopine dehydrogenase-like oxidoreductase [Phlebotomus papatasi]
MSTDRLDVVIFGATGFTGRCAVERSIEFLSKVKWGISGRSQTKLENVRSEVGKKMGKDLSEIPIILADVGDEESLKKMAEQAKVVVNCCGPYRHFGEPVVKACVGAGTHHVDVSGEPQYMERMQLEFDEAAREAGVYVVSACGFDSIPADLGTVFHERHFEGVVNSVETYLVARGKGPGASIHFGTWESAVYGLAHANELRGLRSKLFKERLPQMKPPLKNRPVIHRAPVVRNAVCLPFLGSDRSVVIRSQRYLFETQKKRPIQIRTYMSVGTYFTALLFILAGAIFSIFTRFALGRRLLLAHPKFFSFGFASHEGPSEEKRKNSKFTMWFQGEGWPQALAEGEDQYTDPPTKKLVTKVSGTDFGYGNTAAALLLCATTILNEHTKMPGKGGVLAPGAAFGKTSLIDELNKNQVFTFEVVSAKEEETKN